MGSVLLGKRQLIITTNFISSNSIFLHLVLISERWGSPSQRIRGYKIKNRVGWMSRQTLCTYITVSTQYQTYWQYLKQFLCYCDTEQSLCREISKIPLEIIFLLNLVHKGKTHNIIGLDKSQVHIPIHQFFRTVFT
jgi:hypothetical protein